MFEKDVALKFYQPNIVIMKEFSADYGRLARLAKLCRGSKDYQKILNDLILSLRVFDEYYVIAFLTQNGKDSQFMRSFLAFLDVKVKGYDEEILDKINQVCKKI